MNDMVPVFGEVTIWWGWHQPLQMTRCAVAPLRKRNGKDTYRGGWEQVGVRKLAQELLITCIASDRYSAEALQNVENGKKEEKEYVYVYN